MARRVTEKQKANLKPFKKGFDPRRNLKGGPKSFDQLRELAQAIASEQFDDKRSVVENILETMTKDRKLMQTFLEYAYGKVPQNVEVKGQIESKIEVVNTTIKSEKL